MDQYGRGQDLGRINRRPYQKPGVDRERRLLITMGVGAAIVLIIGTGLGFALGRATAPEPEPVVVTAESTMTSGVVEPVPTETVLPEESFYETESIEATVSADEEPPDTPGQLAPANGAVIDASRVYLRWSEVSDVGVDGEEGSVTYAFEIQDKLSGGSYGRTQVIRDLKETSFSARVLLNERRWRVWAVDEAGNESAKSGWRTYTKKPAPAPKPQPKPQPKPAPKPQPEPEPSDETT
ncbi:MAG: hypothetical protein U1E26_00630 [Coriobacteriia bacterium]|nr:hypothetical protein [Coriobacteriia bacterium]